MNSEPGSSEALAELALHNAERHGRTTFEALQAAERESATPAGRTAASLERIERTLAEILAELRRRG